MVRMLRTPVQWKHKHRYPRLLPSWWPKDTRREKARRRRETEREDVPTTPAERVIVGEELLIGGLR